jgi:hypothetical protein
MSERIRVVEKPHASGAASKATYDIERFTQAEFGAYFDSWTTVLTISADELGELFYAIKDHMRGS